VPVEAVPVARSEQAARWKPGVVIGVVAALAVTLAASILLSRHGSSQPPELFRSSLLPPAQSSFLPRNFALSPDGTRLAFVAIGDNGRTSLWMRTLSTSAAHRLDETEGAMYPFGRRMGDRSASSPQPNSRSWPSPVAPSRRWPMRGIQPVAPGTATT
jgi:hypothetical protein